MLIYRDVRGPQGEDGVYADPDGVIDRENDLVKFYHRKGNPYGFSFQLQVDWKELSVSTYFSASWGGYDFLPKSTRTPLNSIKSSGNYKDMEYTNLPSFWANNMFVYDDVLDADGNVTVAANRDARYPNLRYSTNYETSTFWKIKSTRVTIPYITVAYSLPKSIVQKAGISSCRINLTGQNMISLYNPYPDNFMDPMSGTYGNYPNLRTFTLGVNVSF